MINIFKRDNNIYAPAKGMCKDIIECSDCVFSSKMMGDGIMVIPEEDIVYSPIDGVIKSIFPTKHAFGMELSNGQEIILHIGINTVNLKGKHLELLTNATKVKKGDPLLKFDREYMDENNIDMSIIVILVNNKISYKKRNLNKDVNIKEIILTC